MNLKRDKRQNIQKKLDFSSKQRGEARRAGREETESRQAMHEPESPTNTIRLMEEVCERENLLEALRRVKGNKGSAWDRREDRRPTQWLPEGALAHHPGTTAERDL
jgi:hypothetical protein